MKHTTTVRRLSTSKNKISACAFKYPTIQQHAPDNSRHD
jgi:hypothetical protein